MSTVAGVGTAGMTAEGARWGVVGRAEGTDDAARNVRGDAECIVVVMSLR